MTDVLICTEPFLYCLCGYLQGADDRALCQFHFECVVAQRLCGLESSLGCGAECMLVRLAALQSLLGFLGAPRPGADAAHGDASALDLTAGELKDDRCGGEREFVRGAVAQLEVVRLC